MAVTTMGANAVLAKARALYGKRLTSRTLWLPFPDGGDGTAEDPGSLPLIELKSDNSQEDT